MTATTQLPDHPHHDVHMDGVYFCRCTADAPFVRALEPGNFSYCVMVRSGTLRFETDFPETTEVELRAGDAIAVSGLAPHTFRSAAAKPSDVPAPFERHAMTWKSGRTDVELVLGVAPYEALAIGSLMIGPIIVKPGEHPELSRRLWGAVEMLIDEYADASWIDRNLVIRRLAEIMLINMSRRVFAGRRNAPDEPAPVPTSRHLLSAVNAFIRAPQKAWTLADLSRAAGMSRTRFTEEFKLVTGQSPGRTLSRMRLTAMARRLVTESLSVDAAAEQAGYGSAAAFVRAFQREFGETPARWRRQRRGERRAVRRPATRPARSAAKRMAR